MKTCDTCEYGHRYNNRLYFPCNECEVTKQEKKEFFDTLDSRLKIAKGQFEICDNCKQNTIKEFEKIKEEVCESNEMEYFENSNVWQKWFCNLIDKHIAELKGE